MAPSERFGKYKLVAKIADGGMAEVYLAVVAGLGGFQKRVALKKILPHFTRDDSFVRSFVNEARICGQLHHPNLVQVYEFDRIDDNLYLAMEFIEGLDLERIITHRYLKRSFIPPAVAVEVVLQMLEGLEYAHSARNMENQPLNVVHRDLKPSNILIDSSGVIKIVDFGVAKASSNLYKTMNVGTAKGTVSYMSPEQASGKTDLGPASDLFSVGSILYELLSLRRLFDGDNLFAILDDVRAAPLEPRLSKLKDVPPALLQVLTKALTRELGQRYQSGAEMARELRNIYSENGPALLARFIEELRSEGMEIPGQGIEVESTPEDALGWPRAVEMPKQPSRPAHNLAAPPAVTAVEPDFGETTEWSVDRPAAPRARLRFGPEDGVEVTPVARRAAVELAGPAGGEVTTSRSAGGRGEVTASRAGGRGEATAARGEPTASRAETTASRGEPTAVRAEPTASRQALLETTPVRETTAARRAQQETTPVRRETTAARGERRENVTGRGDGAAARMGARQPEPADVSHAGGANGEGVQPFEVATRIVKAPGASQPGEMASGAHHLAAGAAVPVLVSAPNGGIGAGSQPGTAVSAGGAGAEASDGAVVGPSAQGGEYGELQDFSGSWPVELPQTLPPGGWQASEDTADGPGFGPPRSLPQPVPEGQIESLFDTRPNWMDDQPPYNAPLEPMLQSAPSMPEVATDRSQSLVPKLVTLMGVVVLVTVIWWVCLLFDIRPIELIFPPPPRDITLQLPDLPHGSHVTFDGPAPVERVSEREYRVRLARSATYRVRVVGQDTPSEEMLITIDPANPKTWKIEVAVPEKPDPQHGLDNKR